MRILLVAPRTELYYSDAEISAVVNALRPDLLHGEVDLTRLLEYTNRPWDVIWFATHGTEEGILLSDGILSRSLLTTIVRGTDARLIVLNTCQSSRVAHSIYTDLQVDFLCTMQEVPDKTAYVMGARFAQELSKGISPYEAFVRARPGNGAEYVFLSGRKHDMSKTNTSFSESEADEIVRDLQRLVALIDGDPRWNQDGIINNIRQLRDDMEAFRRDYTEFTEVLERRIAQLEQAIKFYRSAVILLVVLNIMILVAVLSFAISVFLS